MTGPALFIRRPIMTTLVMASILISGLFAYRLLPVNDLPNVDFPTIQVSANLPGANPDTMASAVATPLEKQFSTIAGIDSMTSASGTGTTRITIQFDLSRDIDAAAQDVQAAISRASRQLPQNMPAPPSFQKVNPADQPVIYLAVSSPTLPLFMVNEYADTVVSQRISMIAGVAQVQVLGAQKYAVRAQLDPKALASRRIGIDEVSMSLSNANVNLPTGTLDGRHQAFTIQASGQLYNAAAYRPVIIAYRNGSPVRLEELGRVIDSVENDKVAGWFNSTRAVVLAVQRQPGTNTIEVVNAIKGLLPEFRSQLPASVNLNIIYDRSVSIRESVSDVKFTLALTICLVVLVIFLFLRNLSATIIPSLALPFSLIGACAAMYLMNFSVNNISLMALTLSVGFVVDDAIVMLENIVRHMEEGEGVMEAALKGSREIGFTILSMTLSLVAVFIPVLFMGGIMGRLLHEFAVTISMAILVSGFVSLTLTPMLCSRFLRPPASEGHGRLYMVTERFFAGMHQVYDSTLQTVMRHPRSTVGFVIVLTIVTAWLFVRIPKGFLPSEDTGQIFAFTEAAPGISFEEMSDKQQQLASIVARNSNVAAFMSSVGSGGASGSVNAGRMNMRLIPRNERDLSADEIIRELRPLVASVPGIRMFLQTPPSIRIGGRLTKSQYQYTLQSPDTSVLYAGAAQLETKMRGLPQLQDVTSDLQMNNPRVRVEIDRDKSSALGLSAQKIEDALYYAYGSRQVSTIYAPNNQYQVILELEGRYRTSPSSLELLYIRSTADQLVPLSTVTRITEDLGPLTVNHQGQLPAVTISFDLKPGVAIGDAIPLVEELARKNLPTTISTSFQGTAQAFQTSLKGLWLLLFAAILVIYIVLGILYESFIHPLTILSGLPAAGFGALVTLMIFGIDLSLYGFVGVILLIGIVKKNAIMMIDFALEEQRKGGKTAFESIHRGALVRFRPIMMTTMAALMGTLPIALGFGAGAEARRPLGLAVVGGLLVSQLLTLYITPVVYCYMDGLQERVRRWFQRDRQHEIPSSVTGSGA
ncbi:MAG TPA: efflux RND transporter permease subunit [Geobacteraceae bacterium]|nr:efflux RND transporter permease subunit [Geobacteraceae bacterium]